MAGSSSLTLMCGNILRHPNPCSSPSQFNHVDLALQLLDKSSVGKDIESFRKTKNMLSNVLRGSVDSTLSFLISHLFLC